MADNVSPQSPAANLDAQEQPPLLKDVIHNVGEYVPGTIESPQDAIDEYDDTYNDVYGFRSPITSFSTNLKKEITDKKKSFWEFAARFNAISMSCRLAYTHRMADSTNITKQEVDARAACVRMLCDLEKMLLENLMSTGNTNNIPQRNDLYKKLKIHYATTLEFKAAEESVEISAAQHRRSIHERLVAQRLVEEVARKLLEQNSCVDIPVAEHDTVYKSKKRKEDQEQKDYKNTLKEYVDKKAKLNELYDEDGTAQYIKTYAATS